MKNSGKKLRHQPRIKEPRFSLGTRAIAEIWDKVDADAKKFLCSRSWVIVSILAAHYKSRKVARYDE